MPHLLAAAALCAPLQVVQPAQAEDCPTSYPFEISVDYLEPASKRRLDAVESHHFNADVENLVRGQTSEAGVGGDLAFVLRWIPNHHRALQSLMRLALREKTDTPTGTGPYAVTCWLHRATVFSPRDGRVYLIYGVYLARLGKNKEALPVLEMADKLIEGNANVAYNLGLVHFSLGDFERALEYAKRAYAAGFPLQGLRQKLIKAGKWRD